MTSIESSPQQELSPEEKQRRRRNAVKLKLQVDLMREYLRKYGEESDLSPEGFALTQKWVNLYSDKFREIFNQHADEQQNYIDLAHSDPEKVLEDIKHELYPGEYMKSDHNHDDHINEEASKVA